MTIELAQCASDEVIQTAVRIGGVSEVVIIGCIDAEDESNSGWVVRIKIKKTNEVFCLTTYRLRRVALKTGEPSEPKHFKRLEVAIKTARKITGVNEFTVITQDSNSEEKQS